MYNPPFNFWSKLKKGYNPTPYLKITTQAGVRVLAYKELSTEFELGVDNILNSGDARLMSLGSFSTTIQSTKFDALTATTIKTQKSLSAVLANADNYFGKVIPYDIFLTKVMELWLGFSGDVIADHLQLISLIIYEYILTPDTFTLRANEQ